MISYFFLIKSKQKSSRKKLATRPLCGFFAWSLSHAQTIFRRPSHVCKSEVCLTVWGLGCGESRVKSVFY